MRLIDKTKKSNIKCEHCEHWGELCSNTYDYLRMCNQSGLPKNYWNRCKRFEWDKNKQYKGE